VGKGYRVIPLFADVRPYLEAAWDQAPEGAEYVFPEEYRRRAKGKHGWAGCNLRSTLEKIIKRAKVSQWTRLWHSMRASCETDLAREYPLAVVAKWLGNTVAVAMRHYVDVTDADFERAAQRTQTASAPAARAHHTTTRTSKRASGASSGRRAAKAAGGMDGPPAVKHPVRAAAGGPRRSAGGMDAPAAVKNGGGGSRTRVP